MPRARAFDHGFARALRCDGWTLRAIALHLGVSHVAVWLAVRDIPLIWCRKLAP